MRRPAELRRDVLGAASAGIDRVTVKHGTMDAECARDNGSLVLDVGGWRQHGKKNVFLELVLFEKSGGWKKNENRET